MIGWLAAQPWCNGSVGMTGVSWGGFACVQAAARTPPALKAIAPLHFTDDRYADDVHYRGGCVLGLDMLQWATSMEAYRAQPPDPDLVGEEWRARWRERLDGHEPFILPWLGHQRRDDYWRVGSACEHHERITCDVFAIGGWVDGYRDAVLRMLEHVPGRSRGLIGPWGHTSPESGKPGPEIGFLQELVRFFGASLRGDDNGFWDEPQLIAFIQAATPPATSCEVRAGHWVAEASWPSPAVRTDVLALPDGPSRALRGLQLCGLDAGVWCGDGGPADLPGDQRSEDGASLCWDWPVAADAELLGHVVAELELEADRPSALVAVRLCDVAPDGASTLVAREVFNLTHRHGHDRVEPVVPGERMLVRVPLMSTGYALPAGHTLRLALSPTYWPWAWPSPEAVTLTVHGGHVELPVRSGDGSPPLPQWGPAEAAAPLESESLHAGRLGRTLTHDLATGATELAFDWIDHRTRHKASGTVLGERNRARYRLTEGDPLSAEVECATDGGARARRLGDPDGDHEPHDVHARRVPRDHDAGRLRRRPALPRAPLDARDPAGRRLAAAGRRRRASIARSSSDVPRSNASSSRGHGPQQRLRALRRGVDRGGEPLLAEALAVPRRLRDAVRVEQQRVARCDGHDDVLVLGRLAQRAEQRAAAADLLRPARPPGRAAAAGARRRRAARGRRAGRRRAWSPARAAAAR